MATRGIRNNNPGNIDRNDTVWQGMADDQSGDSRFIVFKSPFFGIRAMARILYNYQKHYGLNTIDQLINRWPPNNENNTEAYIKSVCTNTKIGRATVLDLNNIDTLVALVKAIIFQENAGEQPYANATLYSAVEDAIKG